jgi:UDP-3-O-[3-hydroxymyristoyl] glucosamine N-acyltransferase
VPEGAPRLRLADIQRSVGGQIVGNAETVIAGASNLDLAEPGQLSFIAADKYVETARRSRAAAFVVARHIPELTRPQLVALNPAYTFARIVAAHFSPQPRTRGRFDPIAQGREVSIGADVSIGPSVTLGDRVTIGARCTLYPGVYVGTDVTIGDDCTLYPNVVIMDRCRIGRRVIIHAGSVVGSDGFGYVLHEGRHQKIPQVGIVVIEDDVELGANVTVDRATFGQTTIKTGTKVDNLVQIAHNVTIGEHSIIVAQVGIAGSTTLGHHVALGGQAGVGDHLTVGDGAMLAARSGAMMDIPAGQVVSGNPAIPHDRSVRVHYLVTKLPEMRLELKDIGQRLAALEAALTKPGKTEKAKPRKRR